MSTTARASKKPASPKVVCAKCRHPKPFHPESKGCKAYGCDCKRFARKS